MVTQSKLKELLVYNPNTGTFTWKHCSNITTGGKVFNSQFAGRIAGCLNRGYVRIRIYKQKYEAHRLAWLYMTGNLPPDDIDHINMDRSDNRWANLRLAVRSENRMNVHNRSDNTSGRKGVWWNIREKKWQAAISAYGKRYHLGYFISYEDACKAREQAERNHHGEFARNI